MENILFFQEAVKAMGVGSKLTRNVKPDEPLFSPIDLFENKNLNQVVDVLIDFAVLATEKFKFEPKFQK